MRERGILFSGRLVRALLEGRKTQTRRVVRLQPEDPMDPPTHRKGWGIWAPECANSWQVEDGECQTWRCPYGQPGDLLYVRETWRFLGTDMNRLGRTHSRQDGVFEYRADGARRTIERPWQDVERYMVGDTKWRPSIHMPKWATRIWLELTEVRVERLQEITDVDCLAEGIDPCFAIAPHGEFEEGWDSLAKPESNWDANPWVWVLTFKRVEHSQAAA